MEYLELDMNLTDEQIALKKAVHKFAKEVIRPAAIQLDALADPGDVLKKESIYWDVMGQMKKLGYHTVFIPEHFGGMGLSPLELHIFWEEIAWGSAGFAVSLGVDTFPSFFASLIGEDALIKNIVEPFVNDTGCNFIGCWAITEPDHGSDMLVAGTPYFHDPKITGNVRARREGDGWVINGQKSAWVSNGTHATHALLFLNIDQSMGMAGGGIAIIPLDLPGISRGKPLNKLGQRELPQGEIIFDNVRIPGWCMVAEPDTYEAMLDMTLATANACMGAFFTGVARAAFEEALTYSRERVQGGKLLCEHQLVQKKLFEMFMKVETCRAISRKAMVYNLSNTPPRTEYSIASKVYCTQAAFEVAHEAVQLFGGYGVSKEYHIEKLFRDTRSALIEDGSNDVLGLAAAEAILRNYGA
ncbi:acyl-CoA/acyl-ACP dehydrogenase [Desulfallas sp. Bu1-1]|uniref:acyl-CoA dehydrogenase family protein n=1 Tax=Desulfallas sp. Bu1-1 TaxID=2787620 RepID=UPI00189D982F|nr:acyl-CoA dehydrogenase family protein [Desulfallas sp. Bu1-1]MBF7081814.1 acyl-CoA/acyl-ACP dehydrogenase [Desulfallas sp. Bu1-1]